MYIYSTGLGNHGTDNILPFDGCLFSVWLPGSRDQGPFLRKMNKEVGWSLAFHLAFLVFFISLVLTCWAILKGISVRFDCLSPQGLSSQVIGGLGQRGLIVGTFLCYRNPRTNLSELISHWCVFVKELLPLCRHSSRCLQGITLLRWSSRFFKLPAHS